MLGKVKKWLGIEGVKLELILPEEIDASQGIIQGRVQFYSMHPQRVTFIKVVLIERYTGGRGKDRLSDEYELGAIEMEKVIDIPAHEPVEIDFTLPFNLVKSDVDEFGDRNLLFGGLARVARALNSVSSEFRLEAEARVKGTALHPFDREAIKLQ